MQKTRLETAVRTLLDESQKGEQIVQKIRDQLTGLSYLSVNGKAFNSCEAERRLFNKAFARTRKFFTEQCVTAEGETFRIAGGDGLDDLQTEEAILRVLARTIYRRRTALRLSQQDLAGRTGFTRTYISDMERGARNISFLNLKRLADALEIPLASLIHEAYENTSQ